MATLKPGRPPTRTERLHMMVLGNWMLLANGIDIIGTTIGINRTGVENEANELFRYLLIHYDPLVAILSKVVLGIIGVYYLHQAVNRDDTSTFTKRFALCAVVFGAALFTIGGFSWI